MKDIKISSEEAEILIKDQLDTWEQALEMPLYGENSEEFEAQCEEFKKRWGVRPDSL